MSQMELKAAIVHCQGELSPESIGRLIGEAVSTVFRPGASPPPTIAVIEAAPAQAANGEARTRRPRKERKARADTRPAPVETNGKAPRRGTPKPLLADRIAEHIQLRGPLSTVRLAQLLGGAESAVAIAIGKSKGRFLADDDGNWTINGS